MKTYSTSEIARIMGLHRNTIILYEKWGYISPVARKENGYRVYNETHLNEMKLIRIALRGELIKCYMKFEVKNIIRSVAQGDLRKALDLSKDYLTDIQNEMNNEFKVMKTIQGILKDDPLEEKNISLNRNGVAKLLGVSINVIINCERYGLLEVPRSANGYRVYGNDEIRQLRVIKVLRKENYSTQCIGRMLKNLKTKNEKDNMLVSSLSDTERNVKELIDYIGQLILDYNVRS